MTKLIAALMVAAFLFVGWRVFVYWDQVQSEQDQKQKDEASRVITSDMQLNGMPYQLQPSLDAARSRGVVGFRNWLQTYGPHLQDPRKAWLQLDYVELISRENVAEARRIFHEVKMRTSTNSLVYPRVLKLEKTYD